MAEFGQPSRTATSDANAGVVNAPAQREVARTSVSQNVRTAGALDAPLKNVGSALGGSFVRMLKKNTENVKAQQVLDASLRQGSDNAINAIDSEKKRTGWEKALYGEENPEYRSAQQRAVGNNIQQAYLEQANKVSEFAGESQEEYQGRLRAGLDAQLEKYPNDAGTQQLITEHWSKASEKLVTQQAKEHHGHNLLQQRETVKNGVRGTFDVFTTESKNINTEKEALAFAQNAGDFFNMSAKPADMDAGAYRGVVNEELIYSLQSGNIGAYNMAKDHGWLDTLNTKEQAKFAAAMNKYDVKHGSSVSLVVSEARIAAKNITDQDEIESVLAEASQGLAAQEERSSGTPKSKNAIAKAKLSLDNLLDTAVTAASEAKTKLDYSNDGKAALKNKDAAALYELNADKADLEAAAASLHVEHVGEIVGEEDISPSDAIRKMIGDPVGVGSRVVTRWGDETVDAGFLNIMGQQYVNGFASKGMVDEDGQPTEIAKNTMNLLAQFEVEDRDKFRKQMGDKAYDQYKLISEGQQANQTKDMSDENIRMYAESVGNKDAWATEWTGVLGESGKTRREFVSGEILGLTGQLPTGRNIGTHMETYNRGLTLGKGDHKYAKDYLASSVKNKSNNYNGQAIWNADTINSQLKTHTLPMLLDSLEQPSNNAAIGIIAAGIGSTENAEGKSFTKLSQLGHTEYSVAADGGLWVKNAKFVQNVYVPLETLQRLEEYVTQNKETWKIEEQRKNAGDINQAINKMTPKGSK